MILDCHFTSPIARTEHDDYVREVTVEIRAFNEDAGEDYLVGKIALSQVLWNDAVADGVSLFEICDNDSQGLYEVFTVICDEEEKLRPELEIEDAFDYVVFIY
jgi:hypothetical protein